MATIVNIVQPLNVCFRFKMFFFVIQFPSFFFSFFARFSSINSFQCRVHARENGNMCICHPFPYLKPTKNVFFASPLSASNAFLFHIVINEFICNVQRSPPSSFFCACSPFPNRSPSYPHFMFFFPLFSLRLVPVVRTKGECRHRGVGDWPTTIWFAEWVEWRERNLNFMKIAKNQPSSRIQLMSG